MFFYNADLSKSDKALLSEAVEKISWKYCLKNEFIPIQPYTDEVRDYPEVEVLEVSLTAEKGLRRLAEIVMRAIPYPMLLVFRLGERVQAWMATRGSAWPTGKRSPWRSLSPRPGTLKMTPSGRRWTSGNCALPTSLTSIPIGWTGSPSRTPRKRCRFPKN